MSHFVHDLGLCESAAVGSGTRVWAFAHVLPGARIGADCTIGDHVYVEDDVVVGDRVTVKNGVQLWNGVRLADDVFVGPNVTFADDPLPRRTALASGRPRTVVGPGASLGANATILQGITIGRRAKVGAGAVVTAAAHREEDGDEDRRGRDNGSARGHRHVGGDASTGSATPLPARSPRLTPR